MGRTTSASVSRTERTGPTGLASWDWNTAKYRVVPPSATSSYTTSAWSMPLCGHAADALSILTITAGRAGTDALATGSPVSAARVGTAVVVGAGAVVVGGVCFAAALVPHEARANAPMSNAAARPLLPRLLGEGTVRSSPTGGAASGGAPLTNVRPSFVVGRHDCPGPTIPQRAVACSAVNV